jgi:hypothetical protein
VGTVKVLDDKWWMQAGAFDQLSLSQHSTRSDDRSLSESQHSVNRSDHGKSSSTDVFMNEEPQANFGSTCQPSSASLIKERKVTFQLEDRSKEKSVVINDDGSQARAIVILNNNTWKNNTVTNSKPQGFSVGTFSFVMKSQSKSNIPVFEVNDFELDSRSHGNLSDHNRATRASREALSRVQSYDRASSL